MILASSPWFGNEKSSYRYVLRKQRDEYVTHMQTRSPDDLPGSQNFADGHYQSGNNFQLAYLDWLKRCSATLDLPVLAEIDAKIEIVVVDKNEDREYWEAFLQGDKRHWGSGKTLAAAIGSVIHAHQERCGVKLSFPGDKS